MYIYKGRVIKVIDGDTVDAEIFLGFHISQKMRLRLNGIDTPEKNSPDLETKIKAMEAFAFLKEKVEGKEVVFHTYKADKYGRYLADIYLEEKNINQLLLEKKHAVVYTGGSKANLWV